MNDFILKKLALICIPKLELGNEEELKNESSVYSTNQQLPCFHKTYVTIYQVGL